MSLYARRTKSETVVCGLVDCSFPLGLVIPIGDSGDSGVWLPEGWAPRQGDKVWQVTASALRRLKQGRRATANPGSYRRRDSDPDPFTPSVPLELGLVLTFLPQKGACPSCGQRQIFAHDHLGVSRYYPTPGYPEYDPGDPAQAWRLNDPYTVWFLENSADLDRAKRLRFQ